MKQPIPTMKTHKTKYSLTNLRTAFLALTVAAVPTGMKAGVRISPRFMESVPVRALPSVAEMEN